MEEIGELTGRFRNDVIIPRGAIRKNTASEILCHGPSLGSSLPARDAAKPNYIFIRYVITRTAGPDPAATARDSCII